MPFTLTLPELSRFSQRFVERLGLSPIADPLLFFSQIENDTARNSGEPEERHSGESLWISRSINSLFAVKELFLALPRAAQQEASFAFLLSFPVMTALFQSAPRHSLPMVQRHILSLPGDSGPGFQRQEETHDYCAAPFVGWLRANRAGQPLLSALGQAYDIGFVPLLLRFKEEEAIRMTLNPNRIMIPEAEDFRRL